MRYASWTLERILNYPCYLLIVTLIVTLSTTDVAIFNTVSVSSCLCFRPVAIRSSQHCIWEALGKLTVEFMFKPVQKSYRSSSPFSYLRASASRQATRRSARNWRVWPATKSNELCFLIKFLEKTSHRRYIYSNICNRMTKVQFSFSSPWTSVTRSHFLHCVRIELF